MQNWRHPDRCFEQLERGWKIHQIGYSSIRRTFNLGVRNFEGRCAAQVGNQKGAGTKSRIRTRSETSLRPQMQEEFCFRTDVLARLWRDANGIYRMVSSRTPACLGFTECFRKVSGLYSRKISVTIIEKNRNGLPKPPCGEDQIESVITVDIARNNLKTTCRRDDLKRLPPGNAELKLNPIVRAG